LHNMNKQDNSKFRGIYSLEIKDCGCKIRRYSGGRVITIGCNAHSDRNEYICPICGKKQSKKQLKTCKWSHAYN